MHGFMPAIPDTPILRFFHQKPLKTAVFNFWESRFYCGNLATYLRQFYADAESATSQLCVASKSSIFSER